MRSTQEIAKGNLKSEKLSIESDYELGELAYNFNKMSEGFNIFIQYPEEIMNC